MVKTVNVYSKRYPNVPQTSPFKQTEHDILSTVSVFFLYFCDNLATKVSLNLRNVWRDELE